MSVVDLERSQQDMLTCILFCGFVVKGVEVDDDDINKDDDDDDDTNKDDSDVSQSKSHIPQSSNGMCIICLADYYDCVVYACVASEDLIHYVGKLINARDVRILRFFVLRIFCRIDELVQN